MPRFIYTLFLIFFGNFLVFFYLLFFVPPKNVVLILLFVGTFHLLASLLLSLSYFLLFYKRYKKFNMPNKIFRKIFRRFFIFLFWPLSLLALNIFDLFTTINVALASLFILVFYILLELRMRLPSRGLI